VGDQLGMQLSI